MKTPEEIADEAMEEFTPLDDIDPEYPLDHDVEEQSAGYIHAAIVEAIKADRAQRFYAETITDENTGTIYTPTSFDGSIGYRVECHDGRAEYIMLAPSTWHDVNPDSPAEGDTFLYQIDSSGAADWDEENASPGTGLSLLDLGSPITYVKHFTKGA